MRDGEEFERDEPEFEQEGYLHGKRVNEAKESDDSEGEIPSACPFASMANGMGNLSVGSDTYGGVEPHMPASHTSYLPMPAKKT